jgi:hypothetical protein
MTTNEYLRQVKQNNWRSFKEKLWQRNYYEHIIRNEKEFNNIHRYIEGNPVFWEHDQENPGRLHENGRVLADHYEFSDEELDFIINYDIKYRMGRDTEEG